MSNPTAAIYSNLTAGAVSAASTALASTTSGLVSEVAAADGSQPVAGINVFWIIFILGITSAWHPLGASVGFPSSIRRYVRILPLMPLFDALLLYSELISSVIEKKSSLRASARIIAIKRLKAAIPDADGLEEVQDGGAGVPTSVVIQWLKAIIVFIGLDVRVRFLSNALVVLLYAKSLGYYGTPFSLALATIQFSSWVLNEFFLLLTYGFLWARNIRQLIDAVDQGVATPGRRLSGFSTTASRMNRILFLGQVLAFLGVGIWVIVSGSHHSAPPAPPPPDGLGFWGAIAWFLGEAADKLSIPLVWYLELVMPAFEKVFNIWTTNLFVTVIFFPFFILCMCFMLYPAMFLFIPFEAGMLLIIFSPFYAAMFIFSGSVYLWVWIAESAAEWRRVSPVAWARVGCALVLAALLVYYLHYWDDVGTRKAPWTENLG